MKPKNTTKRPTSVRSGRLWASLVFVIKFLDRRSDHQDVLNPRSPYIQYSTGLPCLQPCVFIFFLKSFVCEGPLKSHACVFVLLMEGTPAQYSKKRHFLLYAVVIGDIIELYWTHGSGHGLSCWFSFGAPFRGQLYRRRWEKYVV